MKVSELQTTFIEDLKVFLPDCKYINSQRHFKKSQEGTVWFLQVGCINHSEDFDALGNVAVEFKAGKERICIVGAELGNIEGIGQNRFPVSTSTEAQSTAAGLYQHFEKHGLSFLHNYSNPVDVVAILKQGGKQAMLMSPFSDQHQDQINWLCSHYDISM